MNACEHRASAVWGAYWSCFDCPASNLPALPPAALGGRIVGPAQRASQLRSLEHLSGRLFGAGLAR